MPNNPDAVAYLQANLDKLPDPDNPGQFMQFLPYSTFPGQFEEQQKLIEENKRRTAAGLGFLLEQGGFSVVKTQDITGPEMLGSHQVVKVQCSACGQGLLQLTPNQQGIVSVSAASITGITHQCAL